MRAGEPARTGTVKAHYDNHLGPVYAWLGGGVDAALCRGAQEIAELGQTRAAGGLAVDLGAGFGMHAIPLARNGFRVVAIDACPALLRTLDDPRGDLPITTVEDDLRRFPHYLQGGTQLVLCMGDTLTHLPDRESVKTLIRDVSDRVEADGHFVATFRDYTHALAGTQRFIPVRNDANRILTCFLEYTRSHVRVHDILHERNGDAWQLQVSMYEKLRLAPDWVVEQLNGHGFAVERGIGAAGMVQLRARRL